MTNHAIFKNYSLTTGIIDIIWGGLLFAASAFIVQTVFKR